MEAHTRANASLAPRSPTRVSSSAWTPSSAASVKHAQAVTTGAQGSGGVDALDLDNRACAGWDGVQADNSHQRKGGDDGSCPHEILLPTSPSSDEGAGGAVVSLYSRRSQCWVQAAAGGVDKGVISERPSPSRPRPPWARSRRRGGADIPGPRHGGRWRGRDHPGALEARHSGRRCVPAGGAVLVASGLVPAASRALESSSGRVDIARDACLRRVPGGSSLIPRPR